MRLNFLLLVSSSLAILTACDDNISGPSTKDDTGLSGDSPNIVLSVSELDFGIVTRPPGMDRRLEARDLFAEEFVVVVRKDDPLTRRSTVTLDALDGRPMVALERGTESRDAVDRALRSAGARPKVVLETGNIEVQKLYAANGIGFAIVPDLAVGAVDRRRLQVRPIRGAPVRREIVAVVNRKRYVPRAAQALLDLVSEATGG